MNKYITLKRFLGTSIIFLISVEYGVMRSVLISFLSWPNNGPDPNSTHYLISKSDK